MCKVEFKDSSLGYRSLAHLRKVNFSDKDLFIDYLLERLGILNESYTVHPISKITFTYIIKSGLATGDRSLMQDTNDTSTFTHNFNNLNLPISMNPEDYGTIISDSFVQTKGDSFHRFIVENNSRIYQIDRTLDNNINYVTIKGKMELSWIDTKVNGTEVFKRDIGKSSIYFADGQVVLRKKQLNAKPFVKLSPDKVMRTSFITMDIETIKSNVNKLFPYLICAYNGTDFISSYGKMVNGVIDQKELFSSFIHQLVTFFNKENSLIVYAHNLSTFDGVFLLKHLLPFGKVKPLIHNGKIISISLTLSIKGYKGKTILFKDSYLLLPHSLRKLCKIFNLDVPKGHFPFLLNDIFYKGILPKLEFWTGLSAGEHLSLSKHFLGKV
jgi:DNA polymerase type B, organellar and viral